MLLYIKYKNTTNYYLTMTSFNINEHLNFETTIQPLTPFLETGICTKTIHNKIAKCKYSIIEDMLNFLFKQKSLKCEFMSYSTYSINIGTSTKDSMVKFYTSYEEKYNKDIWPVCMMKNNKDIIMNILSIDIMWDGYLLF